MKKVPQMKCSLQKINQPYDVLSATSELQDFGVMTETFSEQTPVYDFRKLLAYCEEKDIPPDSLTDAEYKMFQVNCTAKRNG